MYYIVVGLLVWSVISLLIALGVPYGSLERFAFMGVWLLVLVGSALYLSGNKDV